MQLTLVCPECDARLLHGHDGSHEITAAAITRPDSEERCPDCGHVPHASMCYEPGPMPGDGPCGCVRLSWALMEYDAGRIEEWFTGSDPASPEPREAMWNDPAPRTAAGRDLWDRLVNEGYARPGVAAVSFTESEARDIGQRICQIEHEASSVAASPEPALCGEPVALYGVPYGEQYDPCTKPKGHQGHHDPSAAPVAGSTIPPLDVAEFMAILREERAAVPRGPGDYWMGYQDGLETAMRRVETEAARLAGSTETEEPR